MVSTQGKILVINPNSSVEMTDGLETLVRGMYPEQGPQIDVYRSRDGPPSIDDEVTAMESARVAMQDLVATGILEQYSAFLVACYSVHPLVELIQVELERQGLHAHVIGIFEASILTALSLLGSTSRNGRFGIVSTGKYWEKALTDGVNNFLGTTSGIGSSRLASVATTGLNADQLHSVPKEVVKEKMKSAVKSLSSEVSVIILGCAGMAGLDDIVREALVEKYGEKAGKRVFILDGVKCGIGMLENLTNTIPLE